MIKLKNLIQEDAPVDPWFTHAFGKIPFGSSKEIRNLLGKSRGESDTPYEKEILGILKAWVKQPTMLSMTADNLYSYRNLFEKGKNSFPEIFSPKTPNGTELYRGITLINKSSANKWMEQIKTTSPDDYEKSPKLTGYVDEMYRYKFPINYTPHSSIQSWTSEWNIAVEFTNRETIPIVLETTQNDEFLFNQDFMYLLFKKGNESEVLHFGKEYNDDIYMHIPESLYNLGSSFFK